MKYFALLTKLGENLLAQATALGTKLELTHMAVGDGGGSLPTPDTNQTKLIAEKRRAAINILFIDDKNKNQIIAEQIIPEQDGGWWIREIGLFDKAGNLIAVANCPETYKPQLAEGSGRTQSIRMVLVVSHTESVTLKIDPSVVLATREYVNTEITVLDKKIDALSAQTKLDLNKKFDKANISGQKGNDNDKVPSLNLFTTEIDKLAAIGYSYSKIESDGRYQPKGNYAPAGDYATNTALNNGLAEKVNRSDIFTHTVYPNTAKIAVQAVADYRKLTAPNDVNQYPFGVSGGIANGEDMGLPYGYISVITVRGWTDNSAYTASCQLAVSGSQLYLRYNRWIDSKTQELTSVKMLSERNTSTDRNGYIRASTATSEMQGIPIGASILWNNNTPIPDNFWPNEGRSFSATDYPELAKVYPSLKLPDDRGYAIRIADNGRGIDSGRQVGTYQDDAIQRISGVIKQGASTGLIGTGSVSGAFKLSGSASQSLQVLTSQSGSHVEFDSALVVRSANETRMKNVAKILITRVK